MIHPKIQDIILKFVKLVVIIAALTYQLLMNSKYFLWILVLLLAACGPDKPSENKSTTQPADTIAAARTLEAVSLLGDSLYAPELPPARKQAYDSALRVAESNYRQDPDNLEHLIWKGRRLAYLSRYQEAIRVFTEAIRKFPDAPDPYRHRGHRYITTRQFDKAIRDLEKSAALAENKPVVIEPDGIPLPLPADHTPSSLQFNIYYHLGLAYYLNGDYGKAAEAYEKCLTYSQQDDDLAAAADWLYMAYRRLGEDEIAEKTLELVKEDMHIQENEGYFERLLMYKGLIEPDSLLKTGSATSPTDRDLAIATQGYGVGNYYLYEGDSARALPVLQDVVDGRYWAAFGYIAAEADLARIKQKGK